MKVLNIESCGHSQAHTPYFSKSFGEMEWDRYEIEKENETNIYTHMSNRERQREGDREVKLKGAIYRGREKRERE